MSIALAAGLILRLLASRGDLWLDEILSAELARLAARPSDILFSADARTDNNHLLNTLWLYLTGSQVKPVVQRLHSVVAGTAAAGLAALFARRWGTAASIAAAALFSGSFFMIHYGSEARGYAMLVCFVLLAIVVIDRALERRTMASALLFWAACILGTLAHILFVQALVALIAWMAWRLLADPRRRREALAFFPQYLAVPMAFMGVVYVGFVRHVEILGADPAARLDVAGQTAAFIFGFPREGFWPSASLAVAGASVLAGIRALRHRGDDAWVLLAMLCAGAPIVTLALMPPAFLFPRYFIVAAAGVLLLLASALGRLFERGVNGRVASVAVTAAIIAANSADTARLLADGRGHYRRALQDISANTSGATIRIGGDHPFRQQFVIRYHQRAVSPARSFEYITDDRLQEVAPDWVVTHSFAPELPPPRVIEDPFGRGYVLFRTYASGPLSGWHWHVYKKDN